jgi:hypothetical protein
MNTPMAGPMASRIECGMIRVIRLRMPKSVRSRKMTPDHSTMPIATG